MAKTYFIITITNGDVDVQHVSSFGRSGQCEFMTCVFTKPEAFKFTTWREAHSVKRNFIDKVMIRKEIKGAAIVCEYVDRSTDSTLT